MAQDSLEAYGYTALVASDGRSALDAVGVSGDRIRAVVLDLTMPGMTSEETLKHLPAMQPTIPVMIASGYAESEIIHPFEATRINGFLQKPYTAEQLAPCIRAALPLTKRSLCPISHAEMGSYRFIKNGPQGA